MNPGRFILGGTLVVAGGLLLLDQLDVLDAGEVIGRWWPLILVAAGVVQLVVNPRHWFPPVFLGALGIVLLLITTDVIDGVDVWPLFWSTALIVGGVAILVGLTRRGDHRVVEGDRVNAVAIFSGQEAKSRSSAFAGGNLTAIFGGVELDLAEATPARDGALLDVVTIFGGTDVTVPHGWRVDVRGLPVFGGWDNATTKDDLPPDAPLLTIHATVLFGGLDVKHPHRVR